MKTIFNDPLHWSKLMVGSKRSFEWLIGGHIFAYIILGVALYNTSAFVMMVPIFLFAVCFPCGYLFALRKLLLLIEDKNQKEQIRN